MTDRARGYRPDPSAVAARRPKLHLYAMRTGMALTTGALPQQTTNRASVPTIKGGPGILNQHDAGACTGHATAGAATTREAIAGTPAAKLLSPIEPYDLGRLLDLAPDATGALPALQDVGAEPSQVAAGIQEFGWASAERYGKFPASASTINDTIPPETYEAAGEFFLEGAYFLPADSVAMLVGLLSAIAYGEPVTNSVQASGGAFQGYTGGVLRPTDLTGELDHYTYCVDYAFTGTAEQWATFGSMLGAGSLPPADMLDLLHGIFVNSWGEDPAAGGWGEADPISGLRGGFYRANGSALLGMSDWAVWAVVPSGVEQ